MASEDRVPCRPSTWRIVGVFAAYLSLAVVATYPLALRAADHVFGLGTPPLNVWAMGVVLEQLPSEPWNLFEGNAFYPHAHSLAFSEHLFVPALLGAPVAWLTGNLVLTHNVVALLSLALAGLGMFLLARELVGHEGGAFIAGLLYAFHTWNINELIRLQILSNQWFPFLLLALLCFFRTPGTRTAVRVAVFFLLQALSCMYWALYLPLLVVPALAFLQGRARLSLRSLKPLLLSLGAALSVAGLFFLPYWLTSQTMGFERTLPPSISIERWFDVRPGNLLYESLLGTAKINRDAAHFLGFGALALAALGLTGTGARTELKHWRVFLLALASVSFLLSLGPEIQLAGRRGPGPYALLWRFVPGFSHVRYPERFALFVVLGLAPLVAAGAARLAPRFGRYGLALLAGFVFLEHWAVPLDLNPLGPPAAAHRYLAGRDDVRVVAELPASRYRMERHDAVPMYHSTAHWKPTVQGFTGYFPPTTNYIRWRLFHFPASQSVAFLERMGVNTLVVAPNDDGRAPAWSRSPGPWQLMKTFPNGHRILRLPRAEGLAYGSQPKEAGVLVPLDRSRWQVQASEPGAVAAVDGDPRSAWSTGERRQGKGDFFRIAFDRPIEIARISLDVAPAFEFPMRLKVMARLDDGWVRLPFDETRAYDRLFQDLLYRSRQAALHLDFQPIRVHALRVRITETDAFWMPWTLPEIRVYVPR